MASGRWHLDVGVAGDRSIAIEAKDAGYTLVLDDVPVATPTSNRNGLLDRFRKLDVDIVRDRLTEMNKRKRMRRSLTR